MVKRAAIFSLLFATLITAVPAVAEVPPASELNNDQQNLIRQNCGRAQAELRNLQKRDTVLRINRGRLYDMTLRQTGAFISRLDVHKIEAPAVKSTESAIRAEYQQFILDYDHYGDSLNTAITMKCAEKPRDFYDALKQAADDRKVVAKDVANIKQHIGEYSSELGKLRDQKFSDQGNKNE